MEKYRLQLKLKDGQSLGYIQMDNGKPYYDYGYSEATLFDPAGVLNLLNKTPLDKYDVFAEVPYTTNKGRKGKTALKNEELKTYMQNELNDKSEQVMENKTMKKQVNEQMYDELGNAITPEEYAKGVADGTVNEDMKTVKEHLADRLKELGWENLDKAGVEKEIKKMQGKGWYDKYTLDMTLLQHLKEFGNDLTEMYDEYGNHITPEEYAKGVADGTINESVEDETDDNMLALEDYLVSAEGEDPSEVEIKSGYTDNLYDTPWGEYYVFGSYEEAKQTAIEYEKGVLDDIGIDALNWNYMPYEIGHYVDRNWFQEAMEESNQFYIDDIRNEAASSDEFESRLEEEMADAGVETEEEYLEHLNNNYADPIDWYKDNFGDEEFNQVVKEKNLVDLDAVAESVVETDGPANALAGYDGNEIEWEFNGNYYYIYRNN